MALIRVNGGSSSAAGKVLETKSFSVSVGDQGNQNATVTLDETYANGRYGIELTSNYSDAIVVGISNISGNTVTVNVRSYYSGTGQTFTVTGNVIVFE